MMKFGANVTQTALKGLNLAQAGNYDHVLNLKYTCQALPSCFFIKLGVSVATKIRLIVVKFHKNQFIDDVIMMSFLTFFPPICKGRESMTKGNLITTVYSSQIERAVRMLTERIVSQMSA